MNFYIVKGDIFKQHVDAIVLTTSPKLILEGVLGTKALEICGPKLQLELNQLKNPTLSKCVVTNAYNLDCKYIIHVATPKWDGGKETKNGVPAQDLLKASYISCFEKMKEFDLHSVAFPLLSAGAYAFLKRIALTIAIARLKYEAEQNPDNCYYLVLHEPQMFVTYKDLIDKYLLHGGKEFLTHDELVEKERREFAKWYKPADQETLLSGCEKQTLGQRLKFVIKSKGLKNSDCYDDVLCKSAFQKILAGGGSDKYTLVALGLKIKLGIYDINMLLEPIGQYLGYGSTKDEVIMEYINHPNPNDMDGLDIIEGINKKLNEYNIEPLKIHEVE